MIGLGILLYIFQKKTTHRGTGEDPAKATEHQCLNEAQHIKNLKPFYGNAITGKVNSEWAVDGDTHYEQEEPDPEIE